MHSSHIVLFLIFVLGGRCALGGDWPQFRGPTGDGRSDAKNLPTMWGVLDRPTWQVEIPGQGWSSPVVIADRIWLTATEQTALPTAGREAKLAQSIDKLDRQQFQVHASVTCYAVEIAAATGELLRTIELFTCNDPPPIHATNSYASPTPVTDGRILACHFGSLGTAGVDLANGKIVWTARFSVDEVTGPGSSPAIAGGLVILPCDGADQQFVTGLDIATGKTVWKTPRPKIDDADSRRRRAFSTPLVVERDGSQQAIVPGAQWACAYDSATGGEIWRVNMGAGQHAVVPRPVSGDGVVYLCTGFMKPELWAVRLGGRGDVTDTHVTWKYDKQVPDISSPVLAGGEIYFVSPLGIATCLDAKTGAPLWQRRLGGNYAASPLAADGKLYFTSIEGTTTVLRAGNEYEELSRNQLFGQTLASLAVCGEALLVRADRTLYCIGAPGH